MKVKQSEEASSRKQLISKIYGLDLEAREACISFLIEQYPVISREQSEKLIHLIFDNNFKVHLPNHFGRLGNGANFGYPFIWLLNELQVGGIKYLYQNEIWQIHWDISDRDKGYIGRGCSRTFRRGKLTTLKFLVTGGPGEEQLVGEERGLIFFSCGRGVSSSCQVVF